MTTCVCYFCPILISFDTKVLVFSVVYPLPFPDDPSDMVRMAHLSLYCRYRQRPVPECELTKPIFGYSDGKSMLIASTLIEV